jgi:hypothetical protein
MAWFESFTESLQTRALSGHKVVNEGRPAASSPPAVLRSDDYSLICPSKSYNLPSSNSFDSESYTLM